MTATFNARFHHLQPADVVPCATPDEVAAALDRARREGLEVVARSGGHCFAGRSSTEGLIVDLSPMATIDVSFAGGGGSGGVADDNDGELVTVGAGVTLGTLYDALQTQGRALNGGTCPTVGITGLTLGGGLGVLGRTYGVTADRLVGADVVLADGQVVRCDEDQHADLFWALRGAGAGNFGIVTSLTFRSVPAPAGTNLHLTWPIEAAAEVIAAWQAWAPTAPDELYPSLKITSGGDPERPPSVNVYVFAQSDGHLAEGLTDRFGVPPRRARTSADAWPETRAFWAQLPTEDEPAGAPEPSPFFAARSEYFRQALPAGAVAALLEHFTRDRRPGEARELDFMPWGGAYNRVPADATAFVHRDELFQLHHVATVAPSAPAAAQDAALHFASESWTVAHHWGSGGVFPNFPDLDLDDWADAYFGANLPRLREIKARYDPDRLFRAPQSL